MVVNEAEVPIPPELVVRPVDHKRPPVGDPERLRTALDAFEADLANARRALRSGRAYIVGDRWISVKGADSIFGATAAAWRRAEDEYLRENWNRDDWRWAYSQTAIDFYRSALAERELARNRRDRQQRRRQRVADVVDVRRTAEEIDRAASILVGGPEPFEQEASGGPPVRTAMDVLSGRRRPGGRASAVKAVLDHLDRIDHAAWSYEAIQDHIERLNGQPAAVLANAWKALGYSGTDDDGRPLTKSALMKRLVNRSLAVKGSIDRTNKIR